MLWKTIGKQPAARWHANPNWCLVPDWHVLLYNLQIAAILCQHYQDNYLRGIDSFQDWEPGCGRPAIR